MKIRLFPKLKKRRKHKAPVAVVDQRFPAATSLFDPDFYLQVNDDIREAKMDPWLHYCEYGWREDRDPHPLFNLLFYRERYMRGSTETDPLQHYLENSNPLRNTHPLFDGTFYSSRIGELPVGKTLLEHFVETPVAQKRSPSPFFDTDAYLEANPDIAESKMCAVYHYARFGRDEGRKSFIDADQIGSMNFRDPDEIYHLSQYLGEDVEFAQSLLSLDKELPTIVCVSHDATMTGAPLIILKIAESLRRNYGFNIVNLLCRDGDIKNRFEAVGPTYSLDGAVPYRNADSYRFKMRAFLAFLKLLKPTAAYVNSAESRHTLADLSKLGVPIHSLIHENAKCYYKFQPDPFVDIAKHSDRVIFPSAYVQDAALEFGEVSNSQAEIIPQGLLKEELLEPPTLAGALHVREQFNIPPDATLILGCGTGDGRKGLDTFVSTAISLINQTPNEKIYFGWLGFVNADNNMSPSFWANWDVETAGLTDRILFFGTHQNVADFFHASDILYLTSRIDPFPCVVNEAMACGKPIVLFNDGSGCVDLVTEEGGAVVPYGDVFAACKTLKKLSRDKVAQQKAGERNRDHVKNNMHFDDYVATLFDRLSNDMQKPTYGLNQYAPLSKLIRSKNQGKNKKRVYLLSPCWSVSGVNTFAETLGEQLNKNGFDASVLFTTQEPQTLQQDLLPSIPYQYLGVQWDQTAKRKEKLAHFLQSMQPAVVIPNIDYVSSALAVNRSPKVRYVGILHSDDQEHYAHGYRMGHYWDAIISVSNTIQSKLLKMNPSFRTRSKVIRYGINPPQLNLQSANEQRKIEKLKVIYTGRIVQEQKRILDFVELMRELEVRNVPFQFTFVGDGTDLEQFTKAAARYIRSGNCRMAGRLTKEEIHQELSEHHVFCLMSDYEGLPLSLLEALACGCIPVVTHIKSGIDEILTHEFNSLISPLRSPSMMAENFQKLFKTNSLRRKLFENTYNTMREYKLTASDMGDQYSDVIDRIFANIANGIESSNLPLSCPRVERMLDAA